MWEGPLPGMILCMAGWLAGCGIDVDVDRMAAKVTSKVFGNAVNIHNYSVSYSQSNHALGLCKQMYSLTTCSN